MSPAEPSGEILRAPDTGAPLLDNDGEPIRELAVEQVDIDDGESFTIAQLAEGERSFQFGHVIVDEAQDLTPMQWRMVARRALGGSMTIVGDLAQRSAGPVDSWDELLPAALSDVTHQELTVNYRSPAEITELAQAVLSELAPGLSPPRAIRHSGRPPRAVPVADQSELIELVTAERAALDQGRMAVIGHRVDELADLAAEGIEIHDPISAKGLEFDLVLVVEPAAIVEQEHGLGRLYVAITRTTRDLVLAHSRPLPDLLAKALAG